MEVSALLDDGSDGLAMFGLDPGRLDQ